MMNIIIPNCKTLCTQKKCTLRINYRIIDKNNLGMFYKNKYLKISFKSNNILKGKQSHLKNIPLEIKIMYWR